MLRSLSHETMYSFLLSIISFIVVLKIIDFTDF
nr:MAG TPA: hypothetical protein [Caudoviricetes sp.]